MLNVPTIRIELDSGTIVNHSEIILFRIRAMFLLVAIVVFAVVTVEPVKKWGKVAKSWGQTEVIIIYTCYNYIYYYGTVHI